MKIDLKNATDGIINRVTDKKEILDVYQGVVISKGGVSHFITARWLYSSRADGMSAIFCNVFIHGGGKYFSATGKASGCGYCKRSAAFADALAAMNIDTDHDVSGRGMSVVIEAIEGLGKALGYNGKVKVLTG